MAEVDQDVLRIAASLINDIDARAVYGIGAFQSGNERAEFYGERGLVISDFQADFIDFHQEANLLREAGLAQVPVRRVKEAYVPVALSTFVNVTQRLLAVADGPEDDGDFAPTLGDLPDYLRERAYGEDGFELHDFDDARRSMVDLATVSLAIRIAADRGGLHNDPAAPPMFKFTHIGGQRIQTTGCQFEVTSNTPLLRVFWSPAYRPSNNFFAFPTSPASGALLAGAYIFGADDNAGSPITWDMNAIVNLPGMVTTLHLAL